MYMKDSEYNGSTEYQKAIHFLEMGCNCSCSKIISDRSLLNYVKHFKLSFDPNKIYF